MLAGAPGGGNPPQAAAGQHAVDRAALRRRRGGDIPVVITARLMAWMSVRADRANPMLVRRVRQELRNKAFIGAYLLMLLIAVIAAAVASAASGTAGRGMFAAVASAWTALMCIQALGTTRAITSDRGASSWDLIELTGMHPMRIIVGVVQSNLVLGLLGAAGLAPFLVMSYLLRGLDLPTVVFALVSLPMAGALLGAIGAAVACIGNNRQAKQGLGLLMAVGLLAAWGMLTGLWAGSEYTLSRWLAEVLRGDVEAVLALVAVLNGWAAAMAVALVLGAALLTHRALDRSSAPRLLWCAIWLNGLAWLVGVLLYESSRRGWTGIAHLDEILAVASTLGVCWALVLGLFAVSEDTDTTPRQAQAVRSGGALRRAAMTVLGPGAGRGARCTLLLIGLSLVLCSPWMPDTPALIVACHGLLVLALGDMLARGPLARFCSHPAPRRVCTIAVLVVLGFVPSLLSLFAAGELQRILLALSPFTGPVELFSRSRQPTEAPGGWLVLILGALSLCWLAARALRGGSGQARVLAGEDDANPRA